MQIRLLVDAEFSKLLSQPEKRKTPRRPPPTTAHYELEPRGLHAVRSPPPPFGLFFTGMTVSRLADMTKILSFCWLLLVSAWARVTTF